MKSICLSATAITPSPQRCQGRPWGPPQLTRRAALALAVALLAAVSVRAGAQPLPVPQAGLPAFIPGMKEVPDPGLVYKVVFDLSTAGPTGQADPRLLSAARYLNSLAEYGVPRLRRDFVVVFHGTATQFALSDSAFAARHHGTPNPDAALIARMQAAGVSFRVCGQGMIAQKIRPQDLLPTVQMDLWALSTLVNLQLHGYVRVGG
jgi:intracellular sulfur oxidation DsrE/DsrF family protein